MKHTAEEISLMLLGAQLGYSSEMYKARERYNRELALIQEQCEHEMGAPETDKRGAKYKRCINCGHAKLMPKLTVVVDNH